MLELSFNTGIAILTLDRPPVNALNAELLENLAGKLHELSSQNIRAVILRGRGRHFCAGADLEWMQKGGQLNASDNKASATQLERVLVKLATLPVPTIAIAQGAVYGGGLGLIAACDWALANENSRFCLSEVRLGLVPALILPYLKQKLNPIDLRRYAFSAQTFTAPQAQVAGLISVCFNDDNRQQTIQAELEAVLQGGPQAQRHLKDLLNTTDPDNAAVLAEVRASIEAQTGIQAFQTKTPSPWVQTPQEEDW